MLLLQVYPGSVKGSHWKASYHNGRMVMNLQDWLRQ